MTKIECPKCGRVGTTSRKIVVGTKVRCPGCSNGFEYQGESKPIPEWQPEEFRLNQPIPRTRLISTPNKIAVGLLGLALILGVTWFGLVHRVSKPVTNLQRQQFATDVIAERCGRSVAIITDGKRTGSGFIVAPGLVATNAHVIDSMEPMRIFVRFPEASELDQGPILGRVEYYDQYRDLALLRVATRLPAIQTAENHQFRRGQDVVIIGNPTVGGDRLETVVSRAVIGSKIGDGSGLFYQISGSINPGNSGGPILDLFGEVIGVATMKAVQQEGIAFCIPVVDLKSAMNKTFTQSKEEIKAAAQRQEMHLGSSDFETMLDAVAKGDRATMLTMSDVGYVVAEDDQLTVTYRSILKSVDAKYPENEKEIVELLVNCRAHLKDAGKPMTAIQVFRAAMLYAPYNPRYVGFEDFLRSYMSSISPDSVP